MTLSLVVHILFFSAIILSTGKTEKKRRYYAPVYRANLVTVPPKKITKKKLKVIKKTAAASPAKKRKVSKPAKVIKAVSKKKSVKATRVKAKPAKQAKVNTDAAIAAINKRISRKSEVEVVRDKVEVNETIRAIQSAATKQRATAKTGAALSSAAMQRKLQEYKDLLAERISSHWTLPGLKNFKGLEVIVVMKLSHSGELSSLRYEKKSVNGFYNTSVEMALKKASPFPPLPPGGQTMEFGFRFKDDELVR